MSEINLYAAWIGMLLGGIFGAIQGLFFHKEVWLGGYGSWQRRMMRLGHISFFGIAFINIAFVFTVKSLGIEQEVALPSALFIIGAIGMPLICYLSAFKKPVRHLFFIPALSVIGGIAHLIWTMSTHNVF
ncbi:hypothetical protein DWB61_06025 [Ancylomarina euxinus]|uniref:DUF423 domain-containing protein n=1 Tax=Ancylomarina euxinus TaxID=2283627 RepID=A0A425Y3Z8_9BACT|nr:hypothetical protein [Ancylomarina euxinus]MCZ4694595.1 hypothetical protein [Ancylomarina euxinus]MUP14138.1 hypothetical protein [Ancylomarina euxinus]RRG22993.1 hypothetical protein DWB61_06025 [Ancylomarina euxinus]